MFNPPFAFEPVSVPRLYRVIASQIKVRIERHEFKPGTRLPSERELAEALQVSRPTLREALIALEIEGYVEVRVGSGVFVAEPKQDGYWHSEDRTPSYIPIPATENDIGPFALMEARLLIEPQIAALAAKNGTKDQLHAIDAAAHHMLGSPTHSADDCSFHVRIAEASGNAAMVELVKHLWLLHDNSAIFTRLDRHVATEAVWEQAQDEHVAIVNAIINRQPFQAQAAMYAHLKSIMERLRRKVLGAEELTEK